MLERSQGPIGRIEAAFDHQSKTIAYLSSQLRDFRCEAQSSSQQEQKAVLHDVQQQKTMAELRDECVMLRKRCEELQAHVDSVVDRPRSSLQRSPKRSVRVEEIDVRVEGIETTKTSTASPIRSLVMPNTMQPITSLGTEYFGWLPLYQCFVHLELAGGRHFHSSPHASAIDSSRSLTTAHHSSTTTIMAGLVRLRSTLQSTEPCVWRCYLFPTDTVQQQGYEDPRKMLLRPLVQFMRDSAQQRQYLPVSKIVCLWSYVADALFRFHRQSNLPHHGNLTSLSFYVRQDTLTGAIGSAILVGHENYHVGSQQTDLAMLGSVFLDVFRYCSGDAPENRHVTERPAQLSESLFSFLISPCFDGSVDLPLLQKRLCDVASSRR